MDHSSQLPASSDAPAAALTPKVEVKQQQVTEDEEEAESDGKHSGKMGMKHSSEVKSEEKPEVRGATKSSINQSINQSLLIVLIGGLQKHTPTCWSLSTGYVFGKCK